jgi:hypothetical protein
MVPAEFIVTVCGCALVRTGCGDAGVEVEKLRLCLGTGRANQRADICWLYTT